jgi:hypothetical protein
LHAAVLASYTTATLLVQLAVFVSLLEWVVTGRCPAKNGNVYGALLLCGLLLSYCLRWDLALYGFAFALPVLLFVSQQHLRKAWPFFLVLLALIAVDRGLFYFMHSSEAFQYMTYNKLRVSFHDTVKGGFHEDRTPEALAKAGWTLEDGSTFRRWILYDDTMFNVEKLRIFLETNDPQRSLSLLKLVPKRLAENISKRKYYVIVFICTTLALLLAKTRDIITIRRKDAIRIVLAMGSIFSMILYFAYYRFVPRVYVPLFVYFMALTLFLLNLKALYRARRSGSVKFKVTSFMCAAALTACAYGAAYAQVDSIMRLLDRSQKEKSYLLKCLHGVKSRRSGAETILVLMNPSDSLGKEFVHPMKEIADYSDLNFFPGGTSINSPRYYAILRSLDLASGHEFLKWIIDNEKILFAFYARGREQQTMFIDMWESYYNRRISTEGKVRFKTVFDFRNRSGVGLMFFKATKQKS